MPAPAPEPTRAKLPFVLAGVAAVAVLVIGVGVAVILLGGEDQVAKDREALGLAAADGDAEAVAALVAERPELAETNREVDAAGTTELTVGEDGYTVATLELDRGTAYTFSVEGDGGSELVLLDPDGEPVATAARLEPEAAGEHTVVVGGSRTVAVSVVPVLVDVVDITQEQVIELDAPGQVVELELEVRGQEQYEAAIVEAAGYTGRLLDAAGEEVVTLPGDGTYERFPGVEDTTYTLVLDPPEEPAADATSITIDVLELARWWAYAGEEGDPHYLEEEAEPEVVLPTIDTDRGVITWCLDITEGSTVSFQVEPSLAGSVWKMDVFDDAEARDTGTPISTYDDVKATDTFTLEATTGDATYCYDMELLTEGTSSIDVRITDETE